MKIRKITLKKWLTGVLIFVVLIVTFGYIFLRMNTYEAMPEAAALLEAADVSRDGGWITVTPEEAEGHIVLYQGGLVETEAYLPLAKELSEEGFQVFIPQMPLNLAILDTDIVDDIKEAHPSNKEWWLAGHSLGGASASIYAKENHEKIEGVIFLAAYPSDDSDLSDLPLSVLSITASSDAVLNMEQYEQTKGLLPDDTEYMTIQGGNHSNFGHYGFQEGDEESEISREQQQDEIVQSIIDFIIK